MLDFNVGFEFNPDFKVTSKGNVDSLVITSCAIHMSSNDDRMYSDFEDQTYNELNSPSGKGFVDIEIGFAGYSGKSYPSVYTKCFMLYTDNCKLIKPMKMTNNTSESKINQRGETVIGIRYYFRTREEINSLLTCKNILFECFFAFEKTKNTYGVMCQLQKQDGKWNAKYANTYRPKYAKDIVHLID